MTQTIPTRFVPFLAMGLVFATSLRAQEVASRDGGMIKNQDSPHAKLKSVDLRRVEWTDGFWADQFNKCRKVTMPRLWDLAADPEAGHALENMKIAAGARDRTVCGNRLARRVALQMDRDRVLRQHAQT